MVRKHYHNFRYLTNTLKIRLGDLTAHNNRDVKFSKQIAKSSAKITNRLRFLELFEANSKPCETSEMELFPRSRN